MEGWGAEGDVVIVGVGGERVGGGGVRGGGWGVGWGGRGRGGGGRTPEMSA